MIVGHEEKIAAFTKLSKVGELGQAYLFFGEPQIGKRTLATSLAYYFEYQTFEYGNETLIDALILGPDDHDTIGVDAIRTTMRNFLWQTPLRSSYRTVIIDNADVLTPEAQSAMLKIVEEPPSHALLFFIISDYQGLFPPLVSRLARLYFPRVSQEKIQKMLVENYQIALLEAKKIAAQAFGRPGRAIEIATKLLPQSSAKTFETEVEERIIKLWQKDPLAHASRINWLLERLSLIKRYNVNENLQRKAIEQHVVYY
ncbi:hypothetical protein HY967_03830 [Candidatus Jorgensenbacteria bacterium]|nr:hypothetical protein [Candidatus Jorgensenbacteria bacterium]